MTAMPMLSRFALYGFLKNQQYYEPFLILAFLQKGLSFFQIGLLVGFREICVNLMEIPSGAAADVYGRRRAMILSMTAYCLSFMLFALSISYWQLFAAMFLFAIGEAFRTGTHKAMIFHWLQHQGLAAEKTRYYGYTRSWSKIGSAVSVIIAGALVFYTGNYTFIFWITIIPYLLNIVNFLAYPAFLDGEKERPQGLGEMARLLILAFRKSMVEYRLRRLMSEAMIFDGGYKISMDYLQPILRNSVAALPLLVAMQQEKRTALLVAIVYFFLHMLSGWAARQSHRLSQRCRGEDPAARLLWFADFAIFLLFIPFFVLKLHSLLIALFVVLAVLENLWRPMLLSRFDAYAGDQSGATVLSIESQARALFSAIAAPLLGWAVDHTGFWVIGAGGACLALAMLLTGRGGEYKR